MHRLVRFPVRPASWVFALLVLLAPLSGQADADTVVAPGHPSIDSSALVPFISTSSWGTTELSESMVDGRPLLHAVMSVRLPEGPLLVDHIVLDRRSMALAFRFAPYFAVGEDYLTATLRGNQLSGTLVPLRGGEALAFEETLSTPVFSEPLLGLLLASMELEPGQTLSIPRMAISATTKRFSDGRIDLEVRGRERLKAGNGKHYECWVVEASWRGADFQETLWVADRPPYLIQKETRAGGAAPRVSGFDHVSVPKSR